MKEKTAKDREDLLMGKGRPRQLDATQKSHVLAILSVGGSRQLAAQFVGCTLPAIQRAARGDPAFAQALRHAERQPILNHLKNIQTAAKQERHWRASAWLLERKDPQEFAPRGPDIITGQQLHELLTQIVRILVEAIPVASIRKNVIKQLSLLLHALGRPVHEKGKPQ